MKITTRKTHTFIELNVDKIEDTIFSSSELEINNTIDNLLDVIIDLASYSNEINLLDKLKERL